MPPRSRVSCPGYKRHLKWSDKHEVFNTWRPKLHLTRDSAPLPLPLNAVDSLNSTEPNLLVEAFQPTLRGPPTHIAPTGSHASATDAESSSQQTPPQHTNPDPVAFSPAVNNNDNDRSTADILREDLREWLTSHEPMTLLEQQDWTWTLDGPALDCDQASTFVTTLDCWNAAASQGSEFNQALVRYFFDNLCCIHTVLDDTAERFKALVRRYLSTSPLLHKSVVCMAAAHCFQDDESMLSTCLECHTAAVRSLSAAVFQIETVLEQSTDSPPKSALSDKNMLRKLEETLLASIILGFCAPWSDPQDLGLPHLRGARKLCEYLVNYVTMDGKAPEKALANTDHHFLIGAMSYWEACMAFVVDQPKAVVQYLYPFCLPTETTYIHMFAGISLPLLVTLARVGICVRQNRTLRNMVGVGWKDRESYQILASEVTQDAIELAEYAVDYQIPADETFDTKTLGSSTYQQLKAFSQMCKFSILLELQRNFPSLLDSQLDDAEATTPETRPFPRTISLDRWYFDLSGAILSHAQDIPEGSTCGLYQTILLIICGSVLRASKDSRSAFPCQLSLRDKTETQVLSTLARQDELDKRRAFIRRRLQSNCASFGLRQVFSRAELLLEDVWREFDAGTGEADDLRSSRHWVDVMADHKLETFFG
ncbi:uncharacterized protein A1O9_01744 [Exophiala aquamarina CBS 119918]|uniref:Transcription factor domain-containing protein n=1 Tax=Exophiala aquamarina CBS 119918 TaxID=1182545 RepID=A0A072PVA8_9EURO|nr:uncharacterized protein A1O9_01744 [Exophiala aquamarina CBS 119918]KEF63766.1 hypothetical protein A1O9_01744 [Exophiala aquamarina CBS 119918]